MLIDATDEKIKDLSESSALQKSKEIVVKALEKFDKFPVSKNSIETLYKELNDEAYFRVAVRFVTYLLYNSGIDPLEYLDYVPTNFLGADSNLKDVILPIDIKSIEKEAFFSCLNLKSVYIAGNITNIGIRAFYGCEELEEVKFVGNVDNIEDQAFAGCSKLKSVTLPKNCKYTRDSFPINCKIVKK